MENEQQKQTKENSHVSPDQDQERLELLRRSFEVKGRQLRVDLTTGGMAELDELRATLGKEFENPEDKHKAYYMGIQKVLKEYLPKGKEFKEGRDLIYDEKNIFLNRGKKKSDNNGVRGSDGRMTYQPVMNEIVDLVVRWVAESQNPVTLYNMLYDLNEKHGYGHEVYDTTVESFANAIRRLKEE
ncbi:hypothetical protein F0L74_25665 [Chitinophaga agrisoli]|uniref:Uncharacterized protein n=1 Tax=Chitinophaga agrisoli TaxID=2607653 RepID=A0A5B2VL80_9BACT|nr:hypothetical protein [Chitinophaga agrisoli]KAA2239584.1 hypothetical protein F0L74_25665 [Chitinophaga agrisoli]